MIPIIDGQIPVHRPVSLLCTLLFVEIYPGKAKYQAKHEVGIPDSFMHLYKPRIVLHDDRYKSRLLCIIYC